MNHLPDPFYCTSRKVQDDAASPLKTFFQVLFAYPNTCTSVCGFFLGSVHAVLDVWFGLVLLFSYFLKTASLIL